MADAWRAEAGEATAIHKQLSVASGAIHISGTAGELRYVRSGGETNVYGDLDGDAVADFHISLNGEHNLFSNDFVL